MAKYLWTIHMNKTVCNMNIPYLQQDRFFRSMYLIFVNFYFILYNTFGIQLNTFEVESSTFGVESDTFWVESNTFGVDSNTVEVDSDTFGVDSNTFGVCICVYICVLVYIYLYSCVCICVFVPAVMSEAWEGRSPPRGYVVHSFEETIDVIQIEFFHRIGGHKAVGEIPVIGFFKRIRLPVPG